MPFFTHPEPVQPPAPGPVMTTIGDRLRQSGGVISFAEFMSLALYTPEHGYYERSATRVGRHGDFYTSVSVGSLFGELLAFHFAEAHDHNPAAPQVHLVEAGAHDGRLSCDILNWFRTVRPELFSQLQLWLVEPSPRRQAWQRDRLQEFAGQVRWVQDLQELQRQTGGVSGYFYSNELLDAFPVHRVVWRAASHRWCEQGVTFKDEEFQWAWMGQVEPAVAAEIERLQALPEALLEVLPDGFTTEVQPAATAWWSEAAACLRCGQLLTFDYGLTAEEFLLPQRASGTVRGYRSHRPITNPLQDPGEVDLTAQVNFTALRSAGEAVGLRTLGFTSQSSWLTQLFFKTQSPETRFAAWDSARVRQFQTLTHPDHLGRSFRVLVQQRTRTDPPGRS